ncbi:MAG: formylglycine-generating enzyme family protein [Phycisphaerales bacterium]|nr:formylglycine-generating enzyme family protein [Phycisphaerales bacterium]
MANQFQKAHRLTDAMEAYLEVQGRVRAIAAAMDTIDMAIATATRIQEQRDKILAEFSGIIRRDDWKQAMSDARVAEDLTKDAARATDALVAWTAAGRAFESSFRAHLLDLARAASSHPTTALRTWAFARRLLAIDDTDAEARTLEEGARAMVFRTNDLGMTFALIPAGEFMMGTPAGSQYHAGNEIHHPVRLTKAFHLQTTEVTQSQFESVMGFQPSLAANPYAPVENVTWAQAVEFCSRLGQMDGRRYRLPTSAEWEYAARADTKELWYVDESSLPAHEWLDRNSDNQTHPVGRLAANPWGLHDMLGNVCEWCADARGPVAEHGVLRIDPHERPDADTWQYVFRGGRGESSSRHARCATYDDRPGRDEWSWLGFRVVMEYDERSNEPSP